MSDETIGDLLRRLFPDEEEAIRAAPSVLPTAEAKPRKSLSAAADQDYRWEMALALAGLPPEAATLALAAQQGWQPSLDDPATRFAFSLTPPGAALDLYEDGKAAKQAFLDRHLGQAALHAGSALLDAAGVLPGIGLATKAVRGAALTGRSVEEIARAHKVAQRNGTKMLGLPADNTPMDRAAAMGFDVDYPVFHGTDRTFYRFDPRMRGSGTESVDAEAGFFVTPGSEYASAMAKYVAEARAARGEAKDSAQQLLPLLYRSDSPALLRPVGDETGHEIKRRVSDLWKRGHDSVMIANALRPIDDRTLELVIKNPAQLRSRFAAFDPARKNSPDLMASYIAAVLAGTGGIAALKPSHEPPPTD